MGPDGHWILMVEDDPIFSLLFCRAWQSLRPGVQVVVVADLATMATTLREAAAPPRLVVMDRTLPDGNGHEAAKTLTSLNYCWSALGEGGAQPKPQGKSALDEAVQTLAALAGL